MRMYCLLQIYPAEAAAEDGSDDNCCLDAIAAGSEAELQRFLADYKRRYRAACQAFDAWDDMSTDWGPEHDSTHVELLRRYQVYGSLIRGTKFKIVECLSDRRPFQDAKPEP